MSLLTIFVFSALLGSIVLQGKLFTYDCLLKMFLTRKYDCQTEGGGRELINQMIHGDWNIRHHPQEEDFFFFFVLCVCVFLTVQNAINLRAF